MDVKSERDELDIVDRLRSGQYTRRHVLRTAAMGAAGLGLGSGLIAFLEACASGGGGTTTAGGSLVFGLSSYPPSFNPFLNTGAAAQAILWSVHRGLVGYDSKGNIRGEIAETWDVQGASVYTFHLRKNAKFHNGDPVTAADVKYSLDFIRDTANAAYSYTDLKIISDVQAVDNNTVKVTLSQPSASFLPILAEPNIPMVSQKFAAANPNDWMGAGPFTIKSQQKGSSVVLSKFKDFYTAGVPKLDTIKFSAYPDDNLRVTALKAGDVDFIDYPPWNAMDDIKADPNLVLDTTDNGGFMYLQFNCGVAPFNNVKVRQAIGYAINRQDIVDAVFFKHGAPLYGWPVDPSSPYYDQSLASHFSYNPDKAKQLLASAGYSKGFSATLLSNSTYGMHKDTAQAVQNSLTQVGIKLDLKLPDWATRVSLGTKGQFEFAVEGGGGYYIDPDYLAILAQSGSPLDGPTNFDDPQIAELLKQGRASVDVATRKPIYTQLQSRLNDLSPLMFLCWRAQGYAYNKKVQGFLNPPGFLTFYVSYPMDVTSVK